MQECPRMRLQHPLCMGHINSLKCRSTYSSRHVIHEREKIFKSLKTGRLPQNIQTIDFRLFALAIAAPKLFLGELESYENNKNISKELLNNTFIMLQSHVFKSLCSSSVRGQLLFVQNPRLFSSKYNYGDDAEDLDAARKWFTKFNGSTIPSTISETSFSKSSGPGGQKTNK